MGEVYRARDTKLDRDVALKILPPEVASAEALRRFEREARAASSLNHPNIVAIYDVGREESIAYIAMELVDGQTLRGLMTGGPMPIKETLRITAKIADVLASAHEKGVVHRDLKPENVMIARDGYVKLLDFGLAKVRLAVESGDQTQPQQTTAGHVFGTASYMSPEQAAGRGVDFRSDQFSLATIIYEMIVGKRPFDRATAPETLAAIIRDDPPPLEAAEDSPAAELQPVLNRCFAKSPPDRYGSTRDLAHDLRNLRNRLTSGTHSSQRTLKIEAPRLPVIAAVAAVLLILTAGTMLLTRKQTMTEPPRPSQPLAVIPFRDVSGTPDAQIFSDGISEMISARIAQSRAIRVIGPFEGASLPAGSDARDIARRRGAGLVLSGSVQRIGEQVRLSFQLLDVQSGERKAGDMVSAATSDVFSLEDLVADSVLQALNVPRPRRARLVGNALAGADQQKYTEAVGWLQRFRDEKALDRAIESLQALLSNQRDSAAVNSTLGKALLRKYDLTRDRSLVDQAAVYAERAVQLDPEIAEGYITVGELRRIRGNSPDASAAFQQALAMRPDSADARLGLADTYDAMGRAADADRLYREAVDLRPDYPDVYGRYGRFLYTRGRFADAARMFTKQTELLPDAPRGYANLGAALQAMRRYDDAVHAYQKSISLQPTGNGYSNLGVCQYVLGLYPDAAVAFEKATELTPNKYTYWANLGDAYRWAAGQRSRSKSAYDRAIALAREAIAVNPNDARAYATAASCLAKKGDLVTAENEMRLALKADPTDPQVLYHAAVVSNIRGDHEAAIAWVSRAVASGRPADDAARDPEFANLRSLQQFRDALKARKQ